MAGMNYHYYNENDPYAAQWLRNLMAAGHIPEGCVDTRSIVDVQPEDLTVFTQCHFFAGIGGWPLALRLAGWPVDKPVWTGSCPCQPFSVAGKRKGNSDERHLWPEMFRLISECSPSTVFGEQVASADVIGVAADAGMSDVWSGKAFIRVQEWIEGEEVHSLQRLYEIGGSGVTENKATVGARQQEVEGEKQGMVSDIGSAGPSQGKRYPAGYHLSRDSGQGGQGNLRGYGDSVQSGLSASMELPVIGSDRSGGRIYVREYKGRDLRLQRDGECVGRATHHRDRGGANDAEAAELERLLGEIRRESKATDRPEWVTGVRADLERCGYAFGASVLSAASAGAPHIRQRLFWVADATEQGEWRRGLCGPGEGVSAADQRTSGQSGGRGFANGMGNTTGNGREQRGTEPVGRGLEPRRSTSGLGNSTGEQVGDAGQPRRRSNAPGFWGAFDVVPCADGKARRIESGTFPLAHGVPGRVGKLRAYGNAIVPQVAAGFIEAFLEAAP